MSKTPETPYNPDADDERDDRRQDHEAEPDNGGGGPMTSPNRNPARDDADTGEADTGEAEAAPEDEGDESPGDG